MACDDDVRTGTCASAPGDSGPQAGRRNPRQLQCPLLRPIQPSHPARRLQTAFNTPSGDCVPLPTSRPIRVQAGQSRPLASASPFRFRITSFGVFGLSLHHLRISPWLWFRPNPGLKRVQQCSDTSTSFCQSQSSFPASRVAHGSVLTANWSPSWREFPGSASDRCGCMNNNRCERKISIIMESSTTNMCKVAM